MQTEGNSATRRQKVNGRPGIYFRTTAAGDRAYEHDFYDSTGRRRWKAGFRTIKEAEASRESLRHRIRSGERIVPSSITLAEFAWAWLDRQSQLRPRTREKYELAIRRYIVPALGRRRLSELCEEDIVTLIRRMQDGDELWGNEPKAAWTVKGVLTPLGRILGSAARSGAIAVNPMTRLERGERPAAHPREPRELSPEQIEAYLSAAPKAFAALLATATFSGLRLGEVQALRWLDIDFTTNRIRVRWQLDRSGDLVEPKTERAKREVILMPTLARILKAHRLASSYSSGTDFVFASATGTPMNYRNIERRGHDVAAEAAGLNPPGIRKLVFHDLRATFASLLIAGGADVVHVSRQLGHSSPAVTLRFYARLFDSARHAERTSALLEEKYGGLLTQALESDPETGSAVVALRGWS